MRLPRWSVIISMWQMGDRKGRPYIVWRLRHLGALRFGYVGATLAVALLFAVISAISPRRSQNMRRFVANGLNHVNHGSDNMANPAAKRATLYYSNLKLKSIILLKKIMCLSVENTDKSFCLAF